MRVARNAFRLPFEEDFKALSLFSVPDEALFLDVGANRGQSTDAILMVVKNPSAKIHLFEPNEVLFRKLRRMFGDNDRVKVHNFELTDQTKASTLFIPFYREWMCDGLASFDRGEAKDWLKARLFFYDDRLLKLEESVCRVKTLDELALAPFFIKLDIQGYEFTALRGAENAIRTHEPVMLIETPDDLVIDFLGRLGYQYYAYEHGRFRPGVRARANTYFMAASKSSLVADSIDGGQPCHSQHDVKSVG